MLEGGRPVPVYRLLFDLPLTGLKMGPLGLFYNYCC